VESKRACPHDAVTGPLSESKTLRVGLQREWSGQEVLSYPSKLEVLAVFGGDVARMERSVIRGSAVLPRRPPRISLRSIRATTSLDPGHLLTFLSSHRVDDLHRFDAHAGHAAQEINHLLLMIGEAVGVEFLANGWVLWRLLLVLVENPFERGAVPKPVSPRFRWHAGQLCLAVEPNIFHSLCLL
jgi:hypothetical protein